MAMLNNQGTILRIQTVVHLTKKTQSPPPVPQWLKSSSISQVGLTLSPQKMMFECTI